MSPEEQKKQVCLPDYQLSHEPLTRDKLRQAITHHPLQGAEQELHDALKLLETVDRSVSFFGSSRLKSNNVHYKQAKRLAYRIAQEGFTIVTGGGPGIMAAANEGAYDAGGRSIGFNIDLPKEQNLNKYVTENLGFKHFFTRKIALSFAAEAYIYFPGGFGTFDEFFEILTLVQTRKIEQVPIILVGADYWEYVHKLIKHELYEDHHAISKEDMSLYAITDDEDEILEIVKRAPLRCE